MSTPRLTAGGPHYYRLDPESDVGGEVYERMLLERLPAHGIDLVLGLPQDHRACLPTPGWEVDVLRHRLGLHWARAPLTFMPFAMRLLRERRVDLLRGHSVRHTGPALLMARALLRSHVPVVLHHHHLYPRWQQLEIAIMRRADAVVTVSEHSRRALTDAGVRPERVHVVLEGVDRPPTGRALEDAWPSAGLRLLHVGRLEARKRPALAIDTLALLRAQGVPAALVLAGDGPLRSELQGRAGAAGLSESIRFLGRVSDQEKWALYDSAELLLFGSTLEGFGLVVAEAQSRGVPVVAAAGTASAEAMDPNRSGLLAPPTAEAFAAKVGELVDGSRRRAFAQRAREHARRFDWDACAAGVAALYTSLVAR